MIGSATIIQGDARRMPLADQSVQCAITSPPYWALRNYNLAPSIWFEDGINGDCRHEWISAGKIHKGGPTGATTGFIGRDLSARDDAQDIINGNRCLHCNAWLGCFGLEPTPELYIAHMVQIFREVRRVLRDDGTVWLNLGDSYSNIGKWGGKSGNKNYTSAAAGYQRMRRNKDVDPKRAAAAAAQSPYHHGCSNLKPKDQCLIPHRVAIALQADGWYVRDTIIWAKPNPMPSSTRDRTTTSHEYIFLLSKSPRYYFDQPAIREAICGKCRHVWHAWEPEFKTGRCGKCGCELGIMGGKGFGPQTKAIDKTIDDGHAMVNGDFIQSRKVETRIPSSHNKGSVWRISTQSFREKHFATFPEKLIKPMILAGTSEAGCCAMCGAPWKRIASKKLIATRKAIKNPVIDQRDFSADAQDQGSNRQKDGHKNGHANHFVTTGWKPSCECEPFSRQPFPSDPVPCVVLDPFSGAGTTALVAARLGRRAIGIEANPDYCAMAVQRIGEKLNEPEKSHRINRESFDKNQRLLFLEAI